MKARGRLTVSESIVAPVAVAVAVVVTIAVIVVIVVSIVVVIVVVAIARVIAISNSLLVEPVRRRVRRLDAIDDRGALLVEVGARDAVHRRRQVRDVLLHLVRDALERLRRHDVGRRVLAGRRVRLLHGEAAAERLGVAAAHCADVARRG